MIASKELLLNSYLNIQGWHTKRKVIVIESDDWGSIRMPSKIAYENLLNRGIRVDKCNFCRFDSIETEEDLNRLFEVLTSVKDKNGNFAKITANTVVANPDFEKIRESGFKEYFYVTINNLYTGSNKKVIDLYGIGMDLKCFYPQSHGREHLNVARWMRYLNQESEETILAFELGLFGISTSITSEKRKSFLPAFDFEDSQEAETVKLIAQDGLSIFERIFGYKSLSFIAPNYTWGKNLEDVLKVNGVRYIQGGRSHRYTVTDNVISKKRYRIIGSRSNSGLINLTRNVDFEPSSKSEFDWISNCMKNISIAFKWGKPATISTHRVNYMGTLDNKNRDSSLKLLKSLLEEIVKKWPDVEFMSSVELGNLIESNS